MSKIRRLRERAKINQAELARRVDVSQPTISDWENGKKVPSGKNLVRLATELGVKPSQIIADIYDSRVA